MVGPIVKTRRRATLCGCTSCFRTRGGIAQLIKTRATRNLRTFSEWHAARGFVTRTLITYLAAIELFQ